MKVIVCENDNDISSDFEILLKDYSERKKDLDCVFFNSIEDMNEYLALNPDAVNIYIIEYGMIHDDIPARLITHILHRRDPMALMILISDKDSVIPRAFEMGAYRFLLRPFIARRFFALMDQTIDQLKPARENFIIFSNGRQVILSVYDIMYFEKSKRNLTVFTPNGFHVFSLSQKYLVDELDAELFVPSSASCIVNLDYIEKVGQDSLRLTNSLAIPITKNYRQNFMTAYKAYLAKCPAE